MDILTVFKRLSLILCVMELYLTYAIPITTDIRITSSLIPIRVNNVFVCPWNQFFSLTLYS